MQKLGVLASPQKKVWDVGIHNCFRSRAWGDIDKRRSPERIRIQGVLTVHGRNKWQFCSYLVDSDLIM